MSDIVSTVVAIVLIFVGLPLIILWLRDRRAKAQWRRAYPPERLSAERRAYEERILRPDWACVERVLRRPVPHSLRELYADRALITARDLEYTMEHGVSTFEALDEQGMLDTKAWLGFEAIVLATTDYGDPVYLRPGPSEDDVVYVTHHDGGDTEVLASTLAQLRDAIRQANAAT